MTEEQKQKINEMLKSLDEKSLLLIPGQTSFHILATGVDMRRLGQLIYLCSEEHENISIGLYEFLEGLYEQAKERAAEACQEIQINVAFQSSSHFKN